MSAMDWIVIAGGLAAIMWINWYFFLSQRRAIAAGTQEHERMARPLPNEETSESQF